MTEGLMHNWRRSTKCESNACVEVSHYPKVQLISVRNSANPGVTVIFSQAEWRAFVAGVRAGEFDE